MLVNKVKVALRITHNLLDEDIADTIKAARAEMIRSGISSDIANSDADLIQQAIKTYCLWVYASDSKLGEGYFLSWQYQLDNIRKSSRVS